MSSPASAPTPSRGAFSRFLSTLVALALLLTGLQLIFPAVADGAVTSGAASSASNGSISSSLTLQRPSGVANGDLLLAQVTFLHGTNVNVAAPTGWTLADRRDRSNDIGQAIYYKRAAAGETNYTFSFRGNNGSPRIEPATGGIVAFGGVDPTTPIDVAPVSDFGDSQAPTAPSLTTQTAGAMLATFFGINKGTSLSQPTGMTERYEQKNNNDKPTSSANTEVRASAGATGPRASTAGESEKWVAQSVALRAAPTAPVNAAPSVSSISGPTSVSEGASAVAYSSTASDPDGDALTYTWSVTAGNAQISGPSNASGVNVDFGDGSSNVSLKIVVSDGKGGVAERTASVAVANVAPTAAFAAPATVAEGSSISLSLTGPSDPSSADRTAGFTYAFDCGSGYGLSGSASTASCVTTDNGARTVKGQVADKDGGLTEYTATVTVTNIAPSGTLVSQPVDEGSAVEASFANVTDPSSADTAATFTYAFDCGAGFGAWGSSDSATCPTVDSGSKTVAGKVRDKDGGESTTSVIVDVRNVAPTATFSAPTAVNEGSPIALALTDPRDPSSADTTAGFDYAFDCGSGTLGTYSPTAGTTCTTNDDGARTVRGAIQDKDRSSTVYAEMVTIDNVAPSATFGATSPIEGSPIALSLTAPSDPSTADAAAGFSYAFDCGDGAGYGAFGSDATASCPTSDDGERTVGGKIRDQDGGVSEYTATSVVSNAAPTATFIAPGTVAEGSPIGLSLTGASDPSGADTLHGFTYAFDCGDGDGYGPAGAGSTASCSTPDNGTRTVKGTITDKDGGSSEYTATVTITNVAPSATPIADDVNEGEDIVFTLVDPVDPGEADRNEGFSYAFNCGLPDEAFSSFGTVSSVSCPTADNGTRMVKGKIRDKDGGLTEYDRTVTIANVAPSATFGASNPVDEGTAISLSLTGASDPSSADRTAGFTYAFDCGSGYGGFASPATASCPTSDNGDRTVGAKIRDKDGGVSEYTRTVSVLNVAPTAVFDAPASVAEGSSFGLSLAEAFDPSAADTAAGFTLAADCGDGAGYRTGRTVSCSTSDNGGRTVKGKITDKDGGSTEYTATVMVTNVAPTGTLVSQAVDEGSAVEVAFTDVSDPSSADTTFGFTYAFDCGDGAGYGAFGPAATASCPTTDDGSKTVGGKVRDKDGGESTSSVTVDVRNVAPTATFSAPTTVNEGSPIALELTDPQDPSSVDTTAGFDYAFDCGSGTLGTYGRPASTTCTTDDNGGRDVRGGIQDKDGSSTVYSASVAIDNVAPSATFAATSPVEGSPIVLSLTDASDPSSVDAGAGFTYAFDCGAGYGTFGPASTASCSTTDNGARDVGGQIRDKDGGVSEYTATSAVDNAAPTATFNKPTTVDEGSPIGLSLTGVTDPSTADTAAGFTYAFDCGAGYGAFGTASAVSCPTDDNGTRTVKGKVTDKDGGVSEYTATVTITNVNPTVTAPSSQSAPANAPTTFQLGTFTDPGVNDGPWAVNLNWGDGLSENFTAAAPGSLGSRAHTYPIAGTYTVMLTMTDKDGGSGSATFSITVRLTEHALFGNEDVEVSGAKSAIVGDVHANRDVRFNGSGSNVCGDLSAGGTVHFSGTQSCGTITQRAAQRTLPNMANYLPTSVTQTLSGDRSLNGYTCTVKCVVRVTGKLEIRGVVTGDVWFLVEKEVVIKGDLRPASSASKLRIHSKLMVDIPTSKASIIGLFLSDREVKLSGSEQSLTGLFWGKQAVDMSGSKGSLSGAVLSNGSIKLAGSDRSVTYNSNAIAF